MAEEPTYITPVSAHLVALDRVADAIPHRTSRSEASLLRRVTAFLASLVAR